MDERKVAKYMRLAFNAGFNASAEGFNGEYTPQNFNLEMLFEEWVNNLDESTLVLD